MKVNRNQIITIFTSFLFLTLACQTDANRKIKLSSDTHSQSESTKTSSSVIQITPEQQKSIAILYFENETNDPSINWLRRGLADMLETELSQSPYLNIIDAQRLTNIAAELNFPENYSENINFLIQISKIAKIDILISGRYYKQQDSLFIDVEMRNAQSGRFLDSKTVSGANLERIFAMVDDLSQKVRIDLRTNFELSGSAEKNLTAITTSVEAYRCYSKALEHMDKYIFIEAEKCLKDAIRNDSTFANAYLALTWVSMSNGNYEQSEKALSKAKKFRKNLSELDQIRLTVQEMRSEEKYFELLEALKDGVEKYPSNIDMRLDLAMMYSSLGFQDKEIEEFRTILDIDPNRKTAYNYLAYAYARRGDFTTAMKYLDKYEKIAPNEPNPFDSRGDILLMAGKLTKAVRQYQKALVKWPEFYHSSIQLSRIYLELADKQQAVDYLNQAMAVAPGEAIKTKLDYQLFSLYWRFDMQEDADNILNRLIKNNPLNAYSSIQAADFYKYFGNTISAKKILSKTFENYKNAINSDAKAFENLHDFRVFALLNAAPARNTAPLLEKLKPLVKNKFKKIDYDFTLGLLYLREGKKEKAASIFKNSTDSLIAGLLIHKGNSWAHSWKYVFESLNNKSATLSQIEDFSKRLTEKAKETGREDLVVIGRLAQSLIKDDDSDNRSKSLYKKLGLPGEDKWHVIGPFSTEGVSGFTTVYPPESEIKLNKTYLSGDKTVRWKKSDDGQPDGYIDLRSNFEGSEWKAGYGLIYVFSPYERKAQIRLGTDDACKLWLNDRLIWQHFYNSMSMLDQDMVTIVLHEGYNKLLLKVTNQRSEWGYYLRLTDMDGNGCEDITFNTPLEISRNVAVK